MSEKARQDMQRAQSLLDLNPDLTLIRTAYLTGIKLSLIEEWSRKDYLRRPSDRQAAQAATPTPPPQPQQPPPRGRGRPPSKPQDDEWDDGSPVPSVESLRRQIKRSMRDRIQDSLMVSQYATALGRLDGIKEREEAQEEEIEEACTVYLPSEDKEPPEPELAP